MKNSLLTLSECYADYSKQPDEKIQTYIKDSCINRFEYTYETAKKDITKTYPIIDIIPNFINDVKYLIDNLEKILTDD